MRFAYSSIGCKMHHKNYLAVEQGDKIIANYFETNFYCLWNKIKVFATLGSKCDYTSRFKQARFTTSTPCTHQSRLTVIFQAA